MSNLSTSTPEKPRPQRPLTRKQKAFVQQLIDNPKQSATSAAAAVYNVVERNTARSIATENLAKPAIRTELDKYLGTAETTILEVMNTSKEFSKTGSVAGASYAGHAITAARDVMDRVLGKPKQVTETTSTALVLNINLTGITDTPSTET